MSVKSIFEFGLIGLLFALYLSHIPIMVTLAKKYDFQNLRFNVYSVVSTIPLCASGLLLIFGAEDIGGRVATSKALPLILGAFLAVWILSSLFLLFRVRGVDRSTKVKAMISASGSFALSCGAAIGASYVTI
jgi:hypothetical protein